MKTKGDYIKELKAAGIRKGDKDGAIVGLKALKTYQIINLYYDKVVNAKG